MGYSHYELIPENPLVKYRTSSWDDDIKEIEYLSEDDRYIYTLLRGWMFPAGYAHIQNTEKNCFNEVYHDSYAEAVSWIYNKKKARIVKAELVLEEKKADVLRYLAKHKLIVD